MKRVLLATPTYGHSDPAAQRSLRVAMMHTQNVEWVDDISRDREGWTTSRNLSIGEALMWGNDVDGVVWVDSDMKIPPKSIHNLIQYDMPLIGALYFDRRPPHYPVAWIHHRKRPERITNMDNEVMMVDGVGFGLLYTSMDVLKVVKEIRPHEFGEDYSFMQAARKGGFSPTLACHVRCAHQSDTQWVTMETYLRYNSLYRASESLPVDVNPPITARVN